MTTRELQFLSNQIATMVIKEAPTEELDFIIEYSKECLDVIRAVNKVDKSKQKAADILSKYRSDD